MPRSEPPGTRWHRMFFHYDFSSSALRSLGVALPSCGPSGTSGMLWHCLCLVITHAWSSAVVVFCYSGLFCGTVVCRGTVFLVIMCLVFGIVVLNFRETGGMSWHCYSLVSMSDRWQCSVRLGTVGAARLMAVRLCHCHARPTFDTVANIGRAVKHYCRGKRGRGEGGGGRRGEGEE